MSKVPTGGARIRGRARGAACRRGPPHPLAGPALRRHAVAHAAGHAAGGSAPPRRDDLDGVRAPLRPAAAHDLGPEEADRGFNRRVIVAVVDAARGCIDVRLVGRSAWRMAGCRDPRAEWAADPAPVAGHADGWSVRAHRAWAATVAAPRRSARPQRPPATSAAGPCSPSGHRSPPRGCGRSRCAGRRSGERGAMVKAGRAVSPHGHDGASGDRPPMADRRAPTGGRAPAARDVRPLPAGSRRPGAARIPHIPSRSECLPRPSADRGSSPAWTGSAREQAGHLRSWRARHAPERRRLDVAEESLLQCRRCTVELAEGRPWRPEDGRSRACGRQWGRLPGSSCSARGSPSSPTCVFGWP